MMAEQLKSYEWRASRNTPKYPWDEWLNGNVWRLTKGEDYECETHSMMLMLRQKAKERNLKVRVQQEEGGLVCQGGTELKSWVDEARKTK